MPRSRSVGRLAGWLSLTTARSAVKDFGRWQMKNFCCKVSGTGSIARHSLAPSLFSEPSAKTSRPCLEKFILSGGDFLQSALSHCLSLSLSLSLSRPGMDGRNESGWSSLQAPSMEIAVSSEGIRGSECNRITEQIVGQM